MTNHQASDLHVITDNLLIIRRLFGPTMSPERMANGLIHDLLLVDSLPIQVRRVDAWWVVSSGKDWLVQSDGSVSLENFRRVVRFPTAGLEACHLEILLTAFADAVVTRGASDELTWISGDQQRYTLPVQVVEIMRDTTGRVVAFLSTSEPSTDK